MSFITKRKVPTFLMGGGEMGERIRNFDWESTPPGNPDNWPESLRSAVSICLNSNFPIAIYWGNDLTLLYNDAWSGIPGNKHPWALGRAAKEVWPEIWDVLKPQFEKAFNGEPGGSKDALLPMQRHGYVEECYFDFTFTPIYGLEGKVEGVFNAVIETTYQIINERQLQTLHSLGALSKENSIDQIYAAAASVIEKNNKDFPFAVLYEINEEGTFARQVAWAGIGSDETVFPQSIDVLNPKEETCNFCKAYNENKILLSENNGRRTSLPLGAWKNEATHFIHIPISRQGRKFPFAILSAAINPFRKFDESFQQFAQLIADQISTEATNIRAIEEDRKRVEALAEIDKAKTVFFNNISHEFRTPLALMLSPLEEALNEKEIVPLNQKRIAIAHRNAMRLLKLVNSLLDFSRIESGKQEAYFTEVDIAGFTKNLASNFQSVIEKAGLQFTVSIEQVNEPVYVDKEMWEKIVLNLLSNAFKYTLEGCITVNLFSEKNKVVFEVSDTGVGIPENEIPKLFQRFHRVKGNTGRSHEGTGIGLSLVKELVHFHSGTIEVKSENGKGSSFTVSIPTGKEHISEQQLTLIKNEVEEAVSDFYTVEAGSLLESENGNASLALSEDELEVITDALTSIKVNGKSDTKISTVLVADDNADMRDYLQTLLQKTYEVVVAKNGKEALEKIYSRKVDLVLSDIMMPVMDGIELLKEIKNNQQTARVPVILLSARAGEEAKIEGYDIGADDYLVKPFSAKELLARVRAQLKMVKLRNGLEKNVHNLFMQAPALMCILRGPQHVYELANDMYLKVVGYRDIVGKSIRDALPEVEGSGIYEILDKVFTTGESFTANGFALNVDKGNGKLEEVIFNFVYQPYHSANGEIDGIFVHAVDVTDARKAEATNAKLAAIVQSSEDAIISKTCREL